MSAEVETVLQIPQGKLRGKVDRSTFGTEFYCFHKIPYAKPPVGELRFKAPQPADGWEGIRDATQEGPICPATDFHEKTKYQEESDEDSLFLNVFCRQNPNKGGKYPVMVWIHGGGFEFGTGNKGFLGPDYFMMYDVVVVTFNYRLGALGFLSLQTVDCPGNFGLKDQQLVLQWVKNNITYFAGDPNNVTLFGLSAGGASVHYQALYLKNKGLFHRGVAQSGTAVSKWAFARSPRENAFLLGKRLGCDTKDDKVLLEFLRKAPAKDIIVNAQGVINETEGVAFGEEIINITFVPTAEPEHEGAFFTKHPWQLLKEGKQLDVPLITGVTMQEMIFGLGKSEKPPEMKTVEDFQGLIPKDIPLKRGSEGALALAKRLKEFYFKNGVDLESYLNVLSDIYFNYGAYKTIKSRKNCTSPTYLYLFTYTGDYSESKAAMGLKNMKVTTHGSDAFYFFCSKFFQLDNIKPGSRDYDFLLKFTKMWMSFATTGVPTFEGLKWTKTSPEGLEFMDIGENIVMRGGFMRERMLFWDEIYSSFYDK